MTRFQPFVVGAPWEPLVEIKGPKLGDYNSSIAKCKPVHPQLMVEAFRLPRLMAAKNRPITSEPAACGCDGTADGAGCHTIFCVRLADWNAGRDGSEQDVHTLAPGALPGLDG